MLMTKHAFYRLYNKGVMRKLFDALNKLIQEFNSIGNFIKLNASDGLSAVKPSQIIQQNQE